jgi:4-hydroxy-tetrahydrodipicolinate synthase
MRKLGRLLTAMVTPFSEEGEVDYEQVTGTTGESPTVSKEEKLRLFGEVKSAIGEKGAVIANTGSYSTAESLELTKEGAYTSTSGLSLRAPVYPEFFIMCLHAPSLTCQPIPLSSLAR